MPNRGTPADVKEELPCNILIFSSSVIRLINALIFLFSSDSVNGICAFTVAGLLMHIIIIKTAIIVFKLFLLIVFVYILTYNFVVPGLISFINSPFPQRTIIFNGTLD